MPLSLQVLEKVWSEGPATNPRPHIVREQRTGKCQCSDSQGAQAAPKCQRVRLSTLKMTIEGGEGEPDEKDLQEKKLHDGEGGNK